MSLFVCKRKLVYSSTRRKLLQALVHKTQGRIGCLIFRRTRKTVCVVVLLALVTATAMQTLISGKPNKNIDTTSRHKEASGGAGSEQRSRDFDPEYNLLLNPLETFERLVDLGRTVRERCKTLPVNEQDVFPVPRNFFYFRDFHLLWCPVYKAGSSSFLNAFILAGGMTEEDIRSRFLQTNARMLYPVISVSTFMEVSSLTMHIMIVRHPWTRLLSSYRNKIEQTSKWDPYFLANVGTNIVLHTRTLPEGVDPGNARVLAKQAMDHLAFGTFLPEDNPYRFPTLRPTFREFLEYVAEFYQANEHWAPIRSFCSPCNKHLNYHVVKFEDYATEVSSVLYEAGLDQWDARHDNPTTKNASYQTAQLVNTYFRNIETSLLNRLYANYRDDFILFDYAPDQFFPFKVSHDG
ncbi:carbohydrate sulfotransferase 13-like isoform X1 [Oratosquilla oratoria]|uniref:carbohydrate sulfotransferase 13-like isoform X1 n=1 Tax=Oratosquilla oratoria TaxID=337810 RepID=UPI003F762DBF